MFDGVAISSLFDSGATPPEIEPLHEGLELLKGSSSFSLHFGPGFPCEIPSSVTLTILLEGPSPTVDAFMVAPLGCPADPKRHIFFPAGKAGLSGAERAELATGERLAASEEPFALRAQMAADGGLREGRVAGRLDSANLPERVSAEFAGGRAAPKVATGDETFVRYFDNKVSFPQGRWATSDSPVGSSWRARFKYRLSASGNRADFAEFVHLKAGTPFYEGRVAWRWSTQIYIEDPTA